MSRRSRRKERQPTPKVAGKGPATTRLPKGALGRLNIGQSFAEYDPALGDPTVYVRTPAFDAALDPLGGKFFFVGRRGTGKTALRTYCDTHGSLAKVVVPEIFSPASTLFDLALLRNPKKGPFRALVAAFRRVLLGELLLLWRDGHGINATLPPTIALELGGPCSDDFDTRAVSAIARVAEATQAEDDLQIIAENKLAKALTEEMKHLQAKGNYTLLIDSIDDFWDASDQALTYLTAFMHACLEVSTQVPWARALLFLRENIFERVRARDSESSRLETSVSGLDWTQRQLVELVERRLNRPLTAKFPLGGATWDAFFEDAKAARSQIFEFCHNRPRDVLIYVSHAIDSAKAEGHSRILIEDVEGARRRFSDNRLKDLGDEYAENHPQIAVVLARFYGLGRRFTLGGMESLIRGLLNDRDVKRLCAAWIFENQTLELFVRLLYNIGFIGLEKAGRTAKFRALGPQDTSPPALAEDVALVVHRCYWDALDLQDYLVQKLPENTEFGPVGRLLDLPGGLDPSEYEDQLSDLARRLDEIPLGHAGASDFEAAVGDVLRLCFFRGLDNLECRSRSVGGETIKDWVAAIRAQTGFWSIIRQRYSATQVIWECKNYVDLAAEDFHQVSYYLSDPIGKFAIIAFRGETQTTHLKHIQRVANDKGALILPLGIRDLRVFVRQARAGKFKEDHIQDRYDSVVRRIS